MIKQYLKFSTIISFGILLGRLAGYGRELIIASQFNISMMADQVILLLTLPDLINSLLSISTISVVIIPLMHEQSDQVRSLIIDLIKKILILAGVFYVGVGILLFFIYDLPFWQLLMVSFLSILPNALTAVAVMYLQFQNRFLYASLGTFIFNVTIIGWLWWSSSLISIALGVVVACIIRFGFMMIDVFKSPLKIAHQPYQKTQKVTFQLILFSIISNGILFINPTINKLIASLLGEGSTAILTYAEKIYLLPVSVLLTTFAVASFPDMSKMVANQEWVSFKKMLSKSIGVNIVLSLATLVFFVLFGQWIITLLFGLAGISTAHLEQIYSVFLGYSGAMALAGTQAICMNVLFTFKQYRSIAIFSMLILMLNLGLNLGVVFFLKDIQFISINTSLISLASVLILGALIAMHLKSQSLKQPL